MPEMENTLRALASPPQVWPSEAVPHRDWLARWKVSVPSVAPGVEVGVGVGVLVGVAVGVDVGVLVGVAVGVVVGVAVGVAVGVLVGVAVGVAVGVGVGEPDPPGAYPRKEVTVAVPLCVRKRMPQ